MDMNFKGELIVKIMDGENQIWEMPECEGILDKSFIDKRKVSGICFPNGAKSILRAYEFDYSTYESKIIYEDTQTVVSNKFEFVIPNSVNITSETTFTVEISHNGYKTSELNSKFN